MMEWVDQRSDYLMSYFVGVAWIFLNLFKDQLHELACWGIDSQGSIFRDIELLNSWWSSFNIFFVRILSSNEIERNFNQNVKVDRNRHFPGVWAYLRRHSIISSEHRWWSTSERLIVTEWFLKEGFITCFVLWQDELLKEHLEYMLWAISGP